jgi:flagellar biosynthetic protein FliQ
VEAFEGLLRDALVLTALITLPVLVTATAVGASVAIVQAATQIQEQTLAMLPKMLAVGALLAVFGRLGFDLCATLFREAIAAMPLLVHG